MNAVLSAKVCPRCGTPYGAEAAFCPLDGSPLTLPRTDDPYIGSVIAGDIELREVAGSGAMGRVYRGFQRGTERDVAVKILHHELSGRSQLVQRFYREAKIAGKLRHPHVVEVYFTGELADGALYIVMEYLRGIALSGALQEAGGSMPLERVLAIAFQLCDAVGEGHLLGIVHRDIKPENVMLVRRGDSDDWVKVLDFGIARATLPEESMETAAGAVLGTARYISPEGAQGTTVTPASDVYSLAVLLYQMLSGRTPFDADQAVGLLVKHVHEAPPALRGWPEAAHIPREIEHVIMASLAKDPKLRAANGRIFGAELLRAAEESGVVAMPPLQGRASALLRVSSPGPNAADAADAKKTRVTFEANDASRPQIAETIDDVGPAGTNPNVSVTQPDPARAASRSLRWALITFVAFVLGAAIAVLVVKRLEPKPDTAHADLINRTQLALADTHFTAPPGENVKDLVELGLKRWPGDGELSKLRHDAGQQMLTMALAARASGDVIGARNLSRDAYSLIPTDNSARYLQAQSDDDLRGTTNGATANAGLPRLLFESPPLAKPGDRVDMTCRIVPGVAGTKAKIAGIKVSLFPNGKTTSGTPVTLSNVDSWNVKATLVAPTVGSYDVSFEANIDGTVVRAMRDLDVSQ